MNAEKAAAAARQLASEVKDLQSTVTAALKRKQAEGQALQEQLTKSVVERARLQEALQEAEEQVGRGHAPLCCISLVPAWAPRHVAAQCCMAVAAPTRPQCSPMVPRDCRLPLFRRSCRLLPMNAASCSSARSTCSQRCVPLAGRPAAGLPWSKSNRPRATPQLCTACMPGMGPPPAPTRCPATPCLCSWRRLDR